jgi:hypothetical protein
MRGLVLEEWTGSNVILGEARDVGMANYGDAFWAARRPVHPLPADTHATRYRVRVSPRCPGKISLSLKPP